ARTFKGHCDLHLRLPGLRQEGRGQGPTFSIWPHGSQVRPVWLPDRERHLARGPPRRHHITQDEQPAEQHLLATAPPRRHLLPLPRRAGPGRTGASGQRPLILAGRGAGLARPAGPSNATSPRAREGPAAVAPRVPPRLQERGRVWRRGHLLDHHVRHQESLPSPPPPITEGPVRANVLAVTGPSECT
ncbi:hypothetical protein BDV95DRAFT_615918, partial [Massariosphaeria phaeospora]